MKEKIQNNSHLLWELIKTLDNVTEMQTIVSLPRFKLEQSMDLKAQLQQLGIKYLFSMDKADLSGENTIMYIEGWALVQVSIF